MLVSRSFFSSFPSSSTINSFPLVSPSSCGAAANETLREMQKQRWNPLKCLINDTRVSLNRRENCVIVTFHLIFILFQTLAFIKHQEIIFICVKYYKPVSENYYLFFIYNCCYNENTHHFNLYYNVFTIFTEFTMQFIFRLSKCIYILLSTFICIKNDKNVKNINIFYAFKKCNASNKNIISLVKLYFYLNKIYIINIYITYILFFS